MANYIQSSTGAILTDQQVASGNFPAGTFFIEMGTGARKTREQIVGSVAPTYTPPAPVYNPPAPVYTPPAPVYTPPAPVYTPPAPTPAQSQPTDALTIPNAFRGAGLTQVVLGNGTTVYYDNTGQAFDGHGQKVSNTGIAASTAPSTAAPVITPTLPTPPTTTPTTDTTSTGTQPQTNSTIQYYQTPQGNFALDTETRIVKQVVSIPPGSAILKLDTPELPSFIQAGLDSGNIERSTAPEGTDFSGAQGGTAVVDGYGLARFKDSPGVIWLLDGNNKTMRRFADGAFNTIYANTPDAQKAIRDISSADLAPGGAFSGWSSLSDQKYNIGSNGSMLDVAGSASEIQARYGNPVDTAKEQEGVTELDNFLGLLKVSATGIPSAYITQALQDPSMMGFYINARSYGGYTLGDVYKDIMARYLTTQGVTDMSSTRAISPKIVRSDYISTPEGQRAQGNPQLQPPSKIGNLDSEALKYAVGAIPNSLFRVLVPIADPNSPEFKQSMEQVNTAFYDVLLANLSAQSEEEHTQAKFMWDDLRTQLQTTLGISLSNDAMQAWNQFQSYEKSAAGQGIQGSGMEQDAIDTYLQTIRRQDQIQRDSSLSQQDQKDISYYLNYATPDEIAALDPVKRQKWGLEPSQSIKDQISYAALRAKYPLDKYPDMTDDVINGYVGAIIDPSGFYRSALYSKHAMDTWNKKQEKTTYQTKQVINDALTKEEEAYKTFTKADSPFTRYTGDTSALSSGSGTTQTPDSFVNILQALQSTKYGSATPAGTGSGTGTGGTQITPQLPAYVNPNPVDPITGGFGAPAATQNAPITPQIPAQTQTAKVLGSVSTPAPNMSTTKGPVYVPPPQIPQQNQSRPIAAPVSVFSPSSTNQSKPTSSIWNSYKPSTVGSSSGSTQSTPQTLGEMFSPFTKLFGGLFSK